MFEGVSRLSANFSMRKSTSTQKPPMHFSSQKCFSYGRFSLNTLPMTSMNETSINLIWTTFRQCYVKSQNRKNPHLLSQSSSIHCRKNCRMRFWCWCSKVVETEIIVGNLSGQTIPGFWEKGPQAFVGPKIRRDFRSICHCEGLILPISWPNLFRMTPLGFTEYSLWPYLLKNWTFPPGCVFQVSWRWP